MEKPQEEKVPVLQQTVCTLPKESFIRSLLSRRFLRKVGIVFSILVTILLLARLGMGIYADRELNKRLDALRKNGTTVDMAQFASKPIPEDENAANLLCAAIDILGDGNTSNKGEHDLFDYFIASDSKPVLPENRSAVAKALKNQRLQSALRLISDASMLKGCNFGAKPIRGNTFNCEFTRIAKLVATTAFIQSQNGMPNEAFATSLTGIRVAILLAGDTGQSSYMQSLVSLGISLHSFQVVLQEHDFSESQYREAMETLMKTDWYSFWRRDVERGRAIVFQNVQYPWYADSGILDRIHTWLSMPFYKLELARYFDEVENLLNASPSDIETAFGLRYKVRHSNCSDSRILTSMIVANRDLACLVMALKIHKSKTGAYPQSLDEFVPGTIASMPIDLFGGSQYIYEPYGGGFKLYTHGRRFYSGPEQREAPNTIWNIRYGGDIVWEMPK